MASTTQERNPYTEERRKKHLDNEKRRKFLDKKEDREGNKDIMRIGRKEVRVKEILIRRKGKEEKKENLKTDERRKETRGGIDEKRKRTRILMTEGE
jgi:hypothetical protein